MDLSSLNNKQKEAVEKIGGPILVFAGAGSGKTRVLTHKISYLIEEIGLPPKNILAVTFTNKAAQEMKSRIVELVSSDISGISIGTFHSISAQLLRKNISKIGYSSDFTIYDQQDAKAVVKQIIKELNLDVKQYDPKTFYIKISNAKNSMQSPEYFKNIMDNIMDKKFYEIYSRYQQMLKKNNSVDFDDLLILPIQIFKEHPECLLFYQDKFKYVLVDEYQDTNKPQFEFIYAISSIHKDIFVVGDDDQSIYGWRGADISNILNFKEAFGNASVIKLEQNYRSTKNILDAAWHVVSKNINRADKKLWTKNNTGDLIELNESYDERGEAKRVLESVLEYKDKLNKVAILYRINSQSRIIEDELRKSGIPYQIIGGVKFYDRKEIKDILAYLKLLLNDKDSISFDRIINFPARGIGKTTLEKMHVYASKKDISLYHASKNSIDLNISAKQSKSIKSFYLLIEQYKRRLKKESASEITKDLLKDLQIEKFYDKQSTVEATERWLNIEELIASIKEHENNNSNASLRTYLEEVSLLTDIDNWNKADKRVTLMTVHSSKGLEFEYVYIIGLEDGLFPIVRLLEDNNIEEERRLFYVALTRGKSKISLSYAKSRRRFGGSPISSMKSRFLNEIPQELFLKSVIPSIKSAHSYNKNNNLGIINGSVVEHDVFGKGTVVNIEGVGDSSKLTILFINNVRKKLIFKYANLKIIK